MTGGGTVEDSDTFVFTGVWEGNPLRIGPCDVHAQAGPDELVCVLSGEIALKNNHYNYY